MSQALMYCVLCALCWACAPLVMRVAQVGPWMMGVLISIGTALAVVPIIPSQDFKSAGLRYLAIGLTAGIANGLGIVFFYKLVAGSAQGMWELSRVAPIVYVLVPIMIALGSWAIFSEGLTTNKMIGLGLAVLAIWFLNQ